MSHDQYSPEVQDFLNSCSNGPVFIKRPEHFDIVMVPVEFYAAMLYQIQVIEDVSPEQMRADPLLKPVFDRIAKNKAVQPDPE